MASNLEKILCDCGTGKLKEIAREPYNVLQDAYEDWTRAVFYECSTCSKLYRSTETQDKGISKPEIYSGVLTKNEIVKNIEKGEAYLDLLILKKVIGELALAEKNGTSNPQLERDLLHKIGLNDSTIDNLNESVKTPNRYGKTYSSICDYYLAEICPMRERMYKGQSNARKNVEGMLGVR